MSVSCLRFFFSSRRRHTRCHGDWSSDVCSSDLKQKTASRCHGDWSSDVCSSDPWMHGSAAALWLIVMRVLQGVGGAMLMAHSSAILTDAFPHDQRGLALGLNQVAGIGGSFFGLVLGGVLAPIGWR